MYTAFPKYAGTLKNCNKISRWIVQNVWFVCMLVHFFSSSCFVHEQVNIVCERDKNAYKKQITQWIKYTGRANKIKVNGYTHCGWVNGIESIFSLCYWHCWCCLAHADDQQSWVCVCSCFPVFIFVSISNFTFFLFFQTNKIKVELQENPQVNTCT